MGTEIQIKPGDVVCLKSGGPRMTVEDVSDKQVSATWFDGEKLSRSLFNVATVLIRGEKREVGQGYKVREIPEPLNEAIDYTLGESKVSGKYEAAQDAREPDKQALEKIASDLLARHPAPSVRVVFPPDGAETCDACGATAFRRPDGSLACYNFNCIDYFWRPTPVESNTDELVKKARDVFGPIKKRLEDLTFYTAFQFGGEKIPATNWDASDIEVRRAMDARFRLYNKVLNNLLERTQLLWGRVNK